MAFFAARQPILRTDKSVYGYELLFRSGNENVFPDIDEEKATSKMIEGLQLDLGLDRIADGKFAFINFTEESILRNYPDMLPKQKVVIEVLESVKPTRQVFHALKELSDEGYILALDDFVHGYEWEDFYSICSIVKVDCLAIRPEQLSEIIALKKRHPHLLLLAEKVENYKAFAHYQSLGFDLFQGYFFSKPEVMRSVTMSPSQSLLTSLLNELSKPDHSIANVTQLLEADVAVSFKLLRYVQSPIFKRRGNIESIKQAVVLLGKAELERFVMLLFAASVGDDKPTELIRLSMQRAKFCESLARLSGRQAEDSSAFLAGMLSLVDAMLDTPVTDLLATLPLSQNIKMALIEHKGWLADLITMCKLFEKGNWPKIDKASKSLSISLNDLVVAYYESTEWSNDRLNLIK